MTYRVCVIEDDELVRATLCAALTQAGLEVVEADSADQGAKMINGRSCDAAVIDILMPHRDGLDLIRELRETHPKLRIVAVSGGGRVSAALYLKFADQVGADACLEKPVDLEALVHAVRGASVTDFSQAAMQAAS